MPGSALRDNVYIAWDAASGGSIGGGVRVATSSDHGADFSTTRADDPSGPGRSIGASPAVGPNGELYVAWNDYVANAIVFNRSFDGGRSWGVPSTVSRQDPCRLISRFQPNRFAARWSIRHSASMILTVRIAAEYIVRGWI
jgi:hypothetical protein